MALRSTRRRGGELMACPRATCASVHCSASSRKPGDARNTVDGSPPISATPPSTALEAVARMGVPHVQWLGRPDRKGCGSPV